MKKILMTLFLVSMLICSFTAGALANSIAVHALIEPKWEQTGEQTNNDLEGITVDGDITFGHDCTLWWDFTNLSKETDSGD